MLSVHRRPSTPDGVPAWARFQVEKLARYDPEAVLEAFEEMGTELLQRDLVVVLSLKVTPGELVDSEACEIWEYSMFLGCFYRASR